MKYHLFTGRDYYPEGGMGDYAGSFDTLDEAKEKFHDTTEDLDELWAHVAMIESGALVTVARFPRKWNDLNWLDGPGEPFIH